MAKAGMYFLFLVFVACRTKKQCCTESNGGEDIIGVPVGLESGAIPDSSFTASSQKGPNNRASLARLNIQPDGYIRASWSAKINDENQWIQVDLLDTYNVTGLATQGRTRSYSWVSSYKVSCSIDNVTFDTVKDPNNPNEDKIFPGNTDRNSIVFNPLPAYTVCRYVRVIPVTWEKWIQIRMEIYEGGTVEMETTTTDDLTTPDELMTPDDLTTPDELTTPNELTTPDDLTTLDDLTILEESTTPDELTTPFESTTPDELTVHGESMPPEGLTTPDESTTPDELTTPLKFTQAEEVSSRTGVQKWLLELTNEETVCFSMTAPIVVYFSCLCMAFLLRTFFLLSGTKKEPPVMLERPKRMYELVNF